MKDVPIHVVYGKDRRRSIDALDQVITEALGDADPQIALSSFDGGDAELADVLDTLKTLPFLSPKRIVVVKEADDFISKYRSELEKYADSPSETGILIMQAQSFPKTTKLAKIVAKIGEVIECNPVSAKELPGFLTNYAKETYKLGIERDALAMLIDIGGDDAGQLSGEIDKLATYLENSGQKQIKLDDVQALTGHNRQYTVFNVIDAMTANQSGKALELLEQMLNHDRNAEYTAVGAFAWHFRRLYNARILLDKRVPGREITRQLRIWSHPDQFIKQVSKMKIQQIGNILQELLEIDLASKTGGGSVKTGLEKLIVKFCHSQPRVA